MEPEKFYQQRIVSLKEEHAVLLKKKSLVAWLRFAAIVALATAIYLLLPVGAGYTFLVAVLLLALFIRLILVDLKNKNAIKNNQHLQKINEAELQVLAHQYYGFDDGNKYAPAIHSYSNDLDIFGRASLFQYCNRTTSDMGGSTLAYWLLNPENIDMILQRQQAIKELTTVTEWRQQLQAYGMEQKITR